MFIRRPFQGPSGSVSSYEVKYNKGRKPFPAIDAARSFADGVRAEKDGWAEINQVITIPLEGREVPPPFVPKWGDAE